jgi:hypothetical protein
VVTPAPEALAVPVVLEHDQDLAHVLDLDHRAPEALVDRVQVDPAEAHPRPAKRHVLSALLLAEGVVDVHSIRRPKKVQ